MQKRGAWWVFLLAAWMLGCSGGVGGPSDAGGVDGGAGGGAPTADAGGADAGSVDAGSPDAGSMDGGAVDGGMPDAGSLPVWFHQAYLKAANTNPGDEFGGDTALSADGDTLAVGAPHQDAIAHNSGAVYVFARIGETWAQQAYLKATVAIENDELGVSVSLSADGDTLAVGAHQESNDAGAGVAYLFTRDAGVWAQQARLTASNADAHDRFGADIALSGDGNTVAVGAPGEASFAVGIDGDQGSNGWQNSGAVYVFTRATVGWAQQAYLKASNSDAEDNFGSSVSLNGDGDMLAVGAWGEDGFSSTSQYVAGGNGEQATGAAYVFQRAAGMWTQHAYLKPWPTDRYDYFGVSVALSADGFTLAVGASAEDSGAVGINGDAFNNNTENSGAVYLFTRASGTDFWDRGAYVKASNAGENDFFGYSLALSRYGNVLVVGALGEASNATGVGGDRTNNALPRSGAAYVFARRGGAWSEQAYVKATNTDASDVFGDTVAVSGDGKTLAVGGRGEASLAVGVGGNQLDDSAPAAGAVYVLSAAAGGGDPGSSVADAGVLPTWFQQAYAKASNTDTYDRFGSEVAVSQDGSTLVVGAPFEASNATAINGDQANDSAYQAGAAYVFTRAAGTWVQQAYLKASDAAAGDFFGASVALSADGRILAVGAPGEDTAATNSGSAYVFLRVAGVWSQERIVKAANPGQDDGFGGDVALSVDGETLAVGAPFEKSAATGVDGNGLDDSLNGAGAAYVFTRNAGAWAQQAYLKASNTGLQDQFAGSLALSGDGDTLAVGAALEDDRASDSGAVYVFKRSSTVWAQQAFLKATSPGAGDWFGASVALSATGDVLAAGSLTQPFDTGAAFVFARANGTWGAPAVLRSTNLHGYDYFGLRVALSDDGEALAVGAPGEYGAGVGINPRDDGSFQEAGAAYLFLRGPTGWRQEIYVKASNPRERQGFGQGLALSGDGSTLAVGAPGEKSSTAGINGYQSDGSAEYSGAAYVFSR